MNKNIQIPIELFTELVKYHLLDIRTNENEIKKDLQEKMDRITDRQLYTRLKTAQGTEREKARKEYLDRKGVPEKFRW